MSKLSIKSFIDIATQAVTHCVTDRVSGYTAVIDPSFSSGVEADEHTVGTIDSIVEYIDQQNYHLNFQLHKYRRLIEIYFCKLYFLSNLMK